MPAVRGVPVLTYHAANILDNSYAGNDHLALATDLQSLQALGYQVVTLDAVLRWHQGDDGALPSAPCVALTFDDGSDFDARDLPHPSCGVQRSFLGILGDHRATTGRTAAATAFVIASPDARRQLDERSLIGRGWWSDDWWADAEAGGLISIGCHSWDHLHADLDRVAQADNLKGDFARVGCLDDCRRQVRDAGAYIAGKLGGRRPAHFAYPWGQFSDVLANVYLPERQDEHGFAAAWTTEPRPVTRGENRWTLPRYVFGRDWRAPEALADLLER